jgi:hypothetical protein
MPSKEAKGMARHSKRLWCWLAVAMIGFSATFAIPLAKDLWFVFFWKRAPYPMCGNTLLNNMAAGLLGGVLMVGLTVCLTQWKPSFGKVAFWIGIVHLAFWATAVTVAEAFVPNGKVGLCVSAVLRSLLWDLPMVLMYLRDWHQHLLPSNLSCLAPLLIALLVAFYFMPPRWWKSEDASLQREAKGA